jgi:hypothetical protein
MTVRENALFPIVCKLDSGAKFTVAREEQRLKAKLPRLVTNFGIYIDEIPERAKELSPIEVSFELLPMVTEVRPLRP